mmetsp:Transcript_134/g.229  ORF Transcript_134/g.229 Transcript_134/m.229 type:complete len:188 (-) Transcript_134:1360-1923(-)
MIGRVLSVLGWVPVGIVFGTCVGTLNLVEGVSMQPALNGSGDAQEVFQRDIVVINRAAFRSLQNPIVRGDIVAIRDPEDRRRIILKRVTGIAGDEILPSVDHSENAMKSALSERLYTVKQGLLWVEGDNKNASIDSRTFGAVPRALVIGRVDAIVWPPSRAAFLYPKPDYSRIVVEENGLFIPKQTP